MPETDRTAVAVVAGACVVCCLPLIVAAGPVVAAVGFSRRLSWHIVGLGMIT